MSKYNLNEANAAIEALQKRLNAGEKITIDQLKKIIENTQAISDKATNSNHVFVLYHGDNKAGTGYGEIAKDLVNDNTKSYTTVSDTDVGRLFSVPEGGEPSKFHTLLDDIIRQDIAETKAKNGDYSGFTQSDIAEFERQKNYHMSGSYDINSPRTNTSSFWDVASNKFVKENSGKFILLIPEVTNESQYKKLMQSVLGTSEVHELLNKKDGSTLFGLKLDQFAKLAEAEGISPEKLLVSISSAETVLTKANIYIS